MTTGKKRIPRGIRNNNPLNLRVGNNTQAYIATVCQRANLKADEPISWDNTCQMIALLLAMCYVENGREISLDDVVEGWLLAAK